MSLFKQIALNIVLFLFIVLTTIMFLNFQSSQKFVQDQLHSSAEDTAASLALALSGVLGKESSDDEILSEMDIMVAAIYDRGYYASIFLKSEDKVLIDKQQTIAVKDVPDWFISAVVLEAKPATSDVSGGWTAFGTIEVTSHVGHAYVQLWNIFIELLQTFSILAFIFFALFAIMLKMVLRSLVDVERQAKAIERHEFFNNEHIPFTTEFKHVVRAMNSMVGKVKIIFDKEAEALKNYYQLLYTDSVTKLYNRRYLLIQLNSCLTPDAEDSQGIFVFLSLDDLDKAKATLGYVDLEKLLIQTADKINAISYKDEDKIVVRMNNSDFAILMPNVNLIEMKDALTELIDTLQKDFEAKNVDEELHISAAAIAYSPEDSVKTLFSRADFELAKAKIKPHSYIEFDESEENHAIVLGKEEWSKMFSRSIEENMLKVASQKAIEVHNKNNFHEELFLRMIDEEGRIYNAGYFMPVLVNLKLTDNVDKHVVNLAIYHVKKERLKGSVGINISAAFLKNPQNILWLEEQIVEFKKYDKNRLDFEASRFAVTQNLELFSQLSMMLKKHSCYFGIDNFGIDNDGIEYLKDIKPNYIKANRHFFFDLNEDKNATASDSLKVVTSSLGIKLIATAVEKEEDVLKLRDLGVNYVQGSVINEPEILGA
jgi:diguanylate cyclase (GGDEF)-like protein